MSEESEDEAMPTFLKKTLFPNIDRDLGRG